MLPGAQRRFNEGGVRVMVCRHHDGIGLRVVDYVGWRGSDPGEAGSFPIRYALDPPAECTDVQPPNPADFAAGSNTSRANLPAPMRPTPVRSPPCCPLEGDRDSDARIG